MTTVLLKQCDLLSRRWRDVEALDRSELTIQIALVARLRHELRGDVVMFHVPNGEWRDKRSAAKLKAMGLRPGVADLVFDAGGSNILYLELKVPGGRLSEVQRQFKAHAEAIGRHYAVAHSVNEALSILSGHGMVE